MLLLILSPPQLSLASDVDQQYLPYATVNTLARSIDYHGQSFTVGQAGMLARVDIAVSKAFGVTADMDFYLFRIINGNMMLSSALHVDVPNALLPTGDTVPHQLTADELLEINLGSYNFMVQPGDKLGMVVHSTIGLNENPTINWLGGCENNTSQQCGTEVTRDGYTGGGYLSFNYLADAPVNEITTLDLGFRTWVTPVPEPRCVVLFGVGLLGFGARYLSRRYH